MALKKSMSFNQESQRIAGVILLKENGAALLQLRDNKPGLNAAGQWVFPGGHADMGEDIRDCALREFKEETGYLCKDLHWLLTINDGFGPWQPYELTLFWEMADDAQKVKCYEGQALEFILPIHAKTLPMPHYQLLIWQLALEQRAYFTKPMILRK